MCDVVKTSKTVIDNSFGKKNMRKGFHIIITFHFATSARICAKMRSKI